MLDNLLSRWGRRIAFGLMAVGAVYAFGSAVTATGLARPIIAYQLRTMGAYSPKATGAILLLPVALLAYAAGFLFDLVTRQGMFEWLASGHGDDSGPPRMIRIIAVPPGDAPLEVRKAWVGLELPLAPGEKGARVARTHGVLAEPKTVAEQVFSHQLPEATEKVGYAVEAAKAIEILARHAPDAAFWWKRNAPRAIKPGRRFQFAPGVCEELF